MKYRVVAGFISASVIAAALSGCGNGGEQGNRETEMQTLVISDVEVMSEIEADTTEPETESLELELDLSGAENNSGAVVSDEISEEEVINETDLLDEVELENRSSYAGKPGVEETQAETEQTEEIQTEEEQTEKLTEEKTESAGDSGSEKDKEKKTQGSRKNGNSSEKKPATDASKPQSEKATERETEKKAETERETEKRAETETERETETESETETGRETETESETETGRETETESETEPDRETEKKVETEAESAAETERRVENGIGKKTEIETERETETESETETERETETESETETERETETESETETERETETESETETERETETESETETERATETESETETERETEAESETKTGIRILNDSVKVREQASTDATQIALLSTGMQVYVVEESGAWSRILFESSEGLEEGYVRTEFLEGTENLFAVKETINIRAKASTDSEKLGKLTAGDRVLVVEEAEDGWVKIRYTGENGVQEAYVKQEYLEKAEADSSGLLELVEARTQTEAGAQESNSEADEITPETEMPNETEEDESDRETENETVISLGVYTVNDFHVNVREQPSTEAGIMASLSNGMIVYAAAVDGDWTEIYFESADGVEKGYMKTEFLEKSATDDARIADLAKEKMQETSPEPEQVETPAETEETEVLTEETEQEGQTEMASEAETVSESETDMSADMQEEAATVEEQTEAESQTEPVTDIESDIGLIELTEGIESQFELMTSILSGAQSAGIIYSSGNENAKAQVEDYAALAKNYGIALTTEEIESDLDIDLAASQMVESVDCVFCVEDPLVDELLQTVCAYADEMGIPVIGLKQSQLDSGCLAAYDGGVLHWNSEKAIELGLSAETPEFKGNE